MDLCWLDPEHLDPAGVGGATALLEAARVVDCPHELTQSVSALSARLRHGWDGDPTLAGLARDERGRVIGIVEVSLPSWDNLAMGIVEVTVDPVVRQQGLGRRLYAAGVERVRAAGRTLVFSSSFDHPAGIGFLTEMGLEPGSQEIQRRQDLAALDRDRLTGEYAEAEQRAGGYELLRMPTPTQADRLVDVAALTAAINDAPTDDLDYEDEVHSPERIQAFERSQLAAGRRTYRLVARERSSGALAGHTVVGVEGEHPGFGSQYDTSVLDHHRGHRLGLLLKLGMLLWLVEQEPQLRTLDTWNAASNNHMIAVNELLGYQVVASGTTWQRRL